MQSSEHSTSSQDLQINSVLLIQLYGNLQPPNAEPLAIEVLRSTLIKYVENVDVEILLLNPLVDNNYMSLLENALDKQRLLIGLSIPQGTYTLSLEVLQFIENQYDLNCKPVILLGHALPTYTPETFLSLYPDAWVVMGWGEDALVEIYKRVLSGKISFKDIPNLAYYENDRVIYTELRLTGSLLPPPPLRVTPTKFFSRVETSRGCQYGRCTFCTRPPGKKDDWIRFPLEDVLTSIKDLKKSGVEYFTFTDEDFIGNDLDGAAVIAGAIKDIGGMQFSLSVRADNIYNPEGDAAENAKRLHILNNLKEAGLAFVFIGVESLSNSQLRRYGKGISAKDTITATQIVRDLNISLEVGFILFDPFLSFSELEENISNLYLSGLWMHIGYLFSRLRVQRVTPYQQMLAKADLVTDFDANLMSYNWKFQNPRIASIFQTCKEWDGPFENVYRLLRNLERTKSKRDLAQKFMHIFRKIDLNLLKNLVEQVANKNIDLATVPTHLAITRQATVENLYELLAQHAEAEEEQLLLKEIQLFSEHNRKSGSIL